MKKTDVKVLRGDKQQLEEDLVLKERKIYILKDEELRVEIIQLHHDIPAAGYRKRQKTMELVTRNYWWPGVTKDVERYVDGCNMCQRMKNQTETPAGNLMINEVPKKTQTYLMVDFIMKLLLVAGKNAILVVYDRLLKIAHFMVTMEETTAERLVRLFRNNVQKLYGLPESVISNRGPQYVVKLTKELNKILGIETRLSTAFHPQTDRQIEQMNQELEQYLRFFTEYKQRDWLEWLVIVIA